MGSMVYRNQTIYSNCSRNSNPNPNPKYNHNSDRRSRYVDFCGPYCVFFRNWKGFTEYLRVDHINRASDEFPTQFLSVRGRARVEV